MKALAKLTLVAVTMATLGTTTVLAGPGPVGPTNRPAPRHPALAPVAELTCERMVVNKAPKLGGNAVVKCTPMVKKTTDCRIACRD